MFLEGVDPRLVWSIRSFTQSLLELLGDLAQW